MKSFGMILLLTSIGCQSTGQVKVWEFKADDQAKQYFGFYRDNGQEKKSFGDTDVKYGVNQADMEYILDKLRLCTDPALRNVSNQEILRFLLGK